MDPSEYIEGTTVVVAPGSYVVARTDRAVDSAFATVRSDAETTVVVEAGRFDDAVGRGTDADATAATDVERGWRLLTFDATLPFDLVGFLATVATALAEADVSVFVVSAFSTDHVLVKDADLGTALERLRELGCRVERS